MRAVVRPAVVACLAVVVASPAARGASPEAIRAAAARGVEFLVVHEQADDGSFSAEVGPAVTALAVTALVRSGRPADDPAVQKRFADLGQDIWPREQRTPEALAAHHKAEIDKWWPIIKASNIKASN